MTRSMMSWAAFTTQWTARSPSIASAPVPKTTTLFSGVSHPDRARTFHPCHPTLDRLKQGMVDARYVLYLNE
jgi:hypothetical protein